MLVLRILYTFADDDKSGQLSKEEVRKVLQDAAVNQAALGKFDQFFTIVDVDNSNTLNYPEFVMLVLFMFCDGEGIPKPLPITKESHPIGGQYYYIKSCMHGKILDVMGAGGSGAKLIMYKQKDTNDNSNQKFKFTVDGFVEPAHRQGVCFDVWGGLAPGNPVQIGGRKSSDNANQQFRYDNQSKMIYVGNLVLDISGENKDDGATICAWHPKSPLAPNQQWDLVPC